MTQITDITPQHAPPVQNKAATTTPSALIFNPDKYREHIADFELSPEQETELLQTLWNIMVTMADIGFGVDTVQQALGTIFNEVTSLEVDNPLEQNNKEAPNDGTHQ